MGPEFRPRHVSPFHGQFQHTETEDFRQYNHLHVEPEPLLSQARKNFMRRLMPEGLEPALGVGKMGDSRQPQYPVEDPAGDLPRSRLVGCDVALLVPAGSHQHIRLSGKAQKLVDKTQRNTQVRVHEENPFSARAQHSRLHGPPLAVRGRVDENFEPRIPIRFPPGDLFGPVRSRLDYYEEFPFFRWKKPPDFPDRSRQTRFLVSGGNNNTDSRGLIRHGYSDYPKRVSARLSKLPFLEIAIFLVAIFLRLWCIEIKPPHFDEGVNGWFADQMTANGFYHYDPTNYHGPLHFYAVFLSQTLFGRHLWALRLPAIIAGLLCVWAILRFRVFFGNRVARMAAFAMAVSPAYVFYGRYSIHESWQVLFSILLLWGVLGLWQSGGRKYFFTAVLSVAGLILTKETYLLHTVSFLLAGLVLWGWQRVLPSRPALPVTKQLWSRDDAILASGISVLLIVFFYSGNFLDFSSLKGLYETFGAWFHTGVQAAGHEKSTYQIIGPLNWYWVALMAHYEWPALLGFAACLRYVAPSDARLRYTAIMAGGVLLAYSVIPYKTPWCIISMIWPFYLILGGLLEELADRWKKNALPWIVLTPLLACSLVFCWVLNFEKFVDDKEPYVYVQTYSGIFKLTDPLLALAAKDPRNYHMAGLILLDSYYPLPWMLGDFTHVGYYGKSQSPSDFNTGFIAVEKSRDAEIEKHLTQPYYKRDFLLRSAQEECTAYFAAPIFKDYFGGEPEFKPTSP